MIVAPEGWDGDGSRGGCGGAGAVELAEDVEGGDESDEAQRHDEHHGWREAQTRGLVGVESKHVAPSAAGEAPSGGSGGGALAAHAGGSCGRAARGLGLRRGAGHGGDLGRERPREKTLSAAD